MKSKLQLAFAIVLTLLIIGCSDSYDPSSCENHIYEHKLYSPFPPYSELEVVSPNEVFQIWFDFVKCEANTAGLWFQFYPESSDSQQWPAYFYPLEPASVGKVLEWSLPETVWVDAWLENLDGSMSVVYTFLIRVEKQLNN